MNFRHLFLVAFSSLFAIAYGQDDFVYHPELLSKTSLAAIQKLEVMAVDDVEPSLTAMQMVTSEANDVNYSPSEIRTLVYHPMAQVRKLFVEEYVDMSLAEHLKAPIANYLFHYLRDTSIVGTSRGCVVWDLTFSDYCYSKIYEVLPKKYQDSVNTLLVESGWPFASLVGLIENLPQSDSSYHVLEKLVYEKKQVMALEKLMSYRNPKDISAPLAFLSADYKTVYPWDTHVTRQRDRTEAYYSLWYYNYPENSHHFQEIIPELLSNRWNDDNYSGYAMALTRYQKDTVLTVLKEIECLIQPTTQYDALNHIYPILDSLSAEDRQRFLPVFFASLYFPKSDDIIYMVKNHPKVFEDAVSFRLQTQRSAYSDTAILRLILENYLTKDRTSVFLDACKIAQYPVVNSCIDYLKERRPDELHDILYERFKAIIIDSIPSPYEYENYAAEGAVRYADAVPLYRRLTKLILATNNKKLIAENCYIIAGSREPEITASLLKQLEAKKYIYEQDYSLVRSLVLLGDPAINERLVRYYKSLKAAKYDKFELGHLHDELSKFLPLED